MMRPASLVETRRGPAVLGSTLGARDGTVLASLEEREEDEEESREGEEGRDDASTSTEESGGSTGDGVAAKESLARGASRVPDGGASPRSNGAGAGLSAGAEAARADAERAAAAGPEGDVGFDKESEPDRMLVMTTSLMCGEVAYATKSRVMHEKWAQKVEEEWKAQADKERTAGIPVTDVSPQQNARRHLDFIQHVAKPLYTEFCAHFGQKQLLMNINLNANHWNKRCVRVLRALQQHAHSSSPGTRSPPHPGLCPSVLPPRWTAASCRRARPTAAPSRWRGALCASWAHCSGG